MTAVRDGRSVDTTMGFSPLEGVPMATRSGSVDPARSSTCCAAARPSLDEIDAGARARVGAARAVGPLGRRRGARARDRAGGAAGARRSTATASRARSARMAVALGGLDALVVHRRRRRGLGSVRAQVCARLGVPRRPARRRAQRDARRPPPRSPPAARPCAWSSVHAREDVVAARAVRQVLRGSSPRRRPGPRAASRSSRRGARSRCRRPGSRSASRPGTRRPRRPPARAGAGAGPRPRRR